MEDLIIDDDSDDNDKDKDYVYSGKENLDSDNSSDDNDTNSTKTDKDNGQYNGNAQDDETGPILPEGHRFDKKFVCIRYPGKVVNPDKAVETLGGLSSISTAINTPNRRLELRFRPSDGYCKPACGDRHYVSGFILRVRVKKSRIQQSEEQKKQQEAQNYRNLIPAMSTREDAHNEPDEVDKMHSIMDSIIDSNTSDTNNRIFENLNKNDDNKRDKTPKVNPFFKLQKNIPPNFDRRRYEDLSNYTNYRAPKLKVLGQIALEFRFSGLCDFQYLPVTESAMNPRRNECIYELIHPVGILPYKWLDYKVPCFLPPAVFSRMDNVQQYNLKTESKENGPENVIGKTRKRRAGFSNFVNFNSPIIPTQPPKGIEMAMKVKFLNNSHYERMYQLFQERPIWSKTALISKTNFSSEQLKILLPAVAYYFITGPWRVMWVRLGYDPRKKPEARIYQTLDYRLKSMHGLDLTVKGKRTYTNYILPYKSAPPSKPKTAVLTDIGEVKQTKKGKKFSDDGYIYREGSIPPSRQMFYQYCDVHAEEIQEMFAKLPDLPAGTKCHEKRGWLPSGFSDHCRELINKQVRAVLRKKMNIPEDHPTSLPRKRRLPSSIIRSRNSAQRRRELLDRLNKSKLVDAKTGPQSEVQEDAGNTEENENSAEKNDDNSAELNSENNANNTEVSNDSNAEKINDSTAEKCDGNNVEMSDQNNSHIHNEQLGDDEHVKVSNE